MGTPCKINQFMKNGLPEHFVWLVTYVDEVGSVLARHAKAKIPPKACVFFDDLSKTKKFKFIAEDSPTLPHLFFTSKPCLNSLLRQTPLQDSQGNTSSGGTRQRLHPAV